MHTNSDSHYCRLPVLLGLFLLASTIGVAQNVGIGTGTPGTAKLHVYGGYDYGNTVHAMRISGNNPFIDFSDEGGLVNYGFLRSRNNNTTGGFPIGLEIGVTPPPQGQPVRAITFSTNYGPRMTIADNGKVGIGTITPSQWLTLRSTTVESADNTYLLGFEGRNPVITFANLNGVGSGYIKSWTDAQSLGFSNGIILGASPGQNVYLSTNYGPTMVVANSGRVGIGTNSPLGKLHVVETGNQSELIVDGIDPAIDFKHLGNNVGSISVTGQGGISLASYGSGDILITRNFIPEFRLQNNGKLSLGNLIQSFTAGGLNYYGLIAKNGMVFKTTGEVNDANEEWAIGVGCCRFVSPTGNVLDIKRNGNYVAYLDKDGDWLSLSDKNLKTDIRVYQGTLEGLMKIKPFKYRYSDHLNYPETIGFIAQDIQPFFPEVVSSIISNTGEQVLSIKYSKLGVIAIKAIQEQQELIVALQQQNKLLTERVEKLEKKLQ